MRPAREGLGRLPTAAGSSERRLEEATRRGNPGKGGTLKRLEASADSPACQAACAYTAPSAEGFQRTPHISVSSTFEFDSLIDRCGLCISAIPSVGWGIARF